MKSTQKQTHQPKYLYSHYTDFTFYRLKMLMLLAVPIMPNIKFQCVYSIAKKKLIFVLRYYKEN